VACPRDYRKEVDEVEDRRREEEEGENKIS
jgi:hypothetical protein